MEYSELQGNTNVDILHPKVKVKFLSRLVDSKLSNTYLPIYRYSFFINFYRAICIKSPFEFLIIEVSEESVVLGFVL